MQAIFGRQGCGECGARTLGRSYALTVCRDEFTLQTSSTNLDQAHTEET